MDAAYFCFINITTENQIIHVGYRSNSCSVIEGVTHDNRVTDFDGHIQNQTGNGGTNQRTTERGAVLGDAFLYNFQVVFCSLQFLACLLYTYLSLFILFSADKLVVVQLLGTCEVCFGLGSVDFRQPYAAFG